MFRHDVFMTSRILEKAYCRSSAGLDNCYFNLIHLQFSDRSKEKKCVALSATQNATCIAVGQKCVALSVSSGRPIFINFYKMGGPILMRFSISCSL